MKDYSIDEVFGDLVKDPYHLTLSEIENLYFYQVKYIYFRSDHYKASELEFKKLRRDKDEYQEFLQSLEGYKKTFYTSKLQFGLSLEYIHELWDEYLKTQSHK